MYGKIIIVKSSIFIVITASNNNYIYGSIYKKRYKMKVYLFYYVIITIVTNITLQIDTFFLNAFFLNTTSRYFSAVI